MTDAPGPEEGAPTPPPPGPPDQGPAPTGVSELIALIDRLEPMLGASGLDEIEVAAGATTLLLRAPVARRASPVTALAAPPPGAPAPPPGADAQPSMAAQDGLRQVAAPLTGVFYLSPSPGAAPYIKVGGEVIAGQVIGLLEAMKLFNEIKSDVTGVVRAILAEDGALVKTHQVLIEVEPT